MPAQAGGTDAARDDAVVPAVYAVRLTRVQAHLIDEQPASLIDAGFVGSSGRIERALTARGRSMSDLARVICTHGHPDHAGGARELAERGIVIGEPIWFDSDTDHATATTRLEAALAAL
jgi:Metallo-beta-lactamase superfamily.